MTTNSLLVHFAGNTITFDSDHAGLTKAINSHFKKCIGPNGPIIANYKITALNDIEFSISRNGSDLFSNINFEQVLFHFMQDGLTQLNGAPTAELVFHAGALAYDDQGLILCGKSGSGKSTLTARLMADGLQYLTDEVISYPLDGGEISGFCRSLVLKKGSAFVWQRWLNHVEADGLLQFNDGSVWVPPTLFNASAARSRVGPRLILFPSYIADAPFQVERLTSANTLFHLMQTLVNARNLPSYGMEAATQFARQVPAFSLTYSDIEQASVWIQQTITTI